MEIYTRRTLRIFIYKDKEIVFIYLLLEDMEKLVKLLNEYEKDKYGFSTDYFELEIDDETGEPTWWIIDSSEDYFEVTSYYITMKIISKIFWFIKWLVDNNKVDTILFANDLNKVVYLADFNFRNDMWFDKKIYYQLLMFLSISDNPLDYLCSILKE